MSREEERDGNLFVWRKKRRSESEKKVIAANSDGNLDENGRAGDA